MASSGCGSAKIKELTAEVESLKARVAQAEAEKAKLEAELANAQKEQQQIAAIKKGYEDARQQFAVQMKALAPLLGDVGSPLPPFEGLADSSWVGKLAPRRKLAPERQGTGKRSEGTHGRPRGEAGTVSGGVATADLALRRHGPRSFPVLRFRTPTPDAAFAQKRRNLEDRG